MISDIFIRDYTTIAKETIPPKSKQHYVSGVQQCWVRVAVRLWQQIGGYFVESPASR